ncbi:MAG: alpha/beta fold hydrolase [Planctomycetota bacterium]
MTMHLRLLAALAALTLLLAGTPASAQPSPDPANSYQRWIGWISSDSHRDVFELRVRRGANGGNLTGTMTWVEGQLIQAPVLALNVIRRDVTFAFVRDGIRIEFTGRVADDQRGISGKLTTSPGGDAYGQLELALSQPIETMALCESWVAKIGQGENTITLLLQLGRTSMDAAGEWHGAVSTDLPSLDGDHVIDVPLFELVVSDTKLTARVPSSSRNDTRLELSRKPDGKEMSGAINSGASGRTPVTFRLLERKTNGSSAVTPTPAPAKENLAAGRWLGRVEWDGASLVIEVQIVHDTATADRPWSGRIALPSRGIAMSPLDGFEIDGRHVKVRLDVIGGAWPDLTLDGMIGGEHDDVLTGKLAANDARHDMRLLRVPAFADAEERSYWNGNVNAGLQQIEINLKIARDGHGGWMASLDIVADRVTDIPLFDVTIDGAKVAMKIPSRAAPQTLTGTIGADGKSMSGLLDVGQQQLTFSLDRVDAPREAHRPQEPQPPFPYVGHDVTFDAPDDAGSVKLAGTLWVPDGEGPFPAAIIISGSGPQDRDGSLFGHKPYRVLADHLARHGIAVLCVDDRGVGRSAGSLEDLTTDDLSLDAAAALAFLGTRNDIDRARIGLIGHSEGGLIAPMVAASHPDDVAFVVMLAGPGVRGDALLIEQNRLISKASGFSGEFIKVQRTMLDDVFAAVVKDDLHGDELRARVKAALSTFYTSMPMADRLSQPPMAQALEAWMAQLEIPWLRAFLAHDPAPALQRMRCPLLALNGTHDVQVAWQQNLPAILAARAAAGDDADVTTRALPRLNHLFQTCETGSPTEYATTEETFAPVALRAISDWILERVATHGY